MSKPAAPKKTLKRRRRANTERVFVGAVRGGGADVFWDAVGDDEAAPPVVRQLAAGCDVIGALRGEALSARKWAREQDAWDPEHEALRIVGARQHAHQVKVTAEEEAALKVRAAEHDITVPRLLLESALARGGETSSDRQAALVELFAVRRQLAGLATNVNQIAHAVNTDGRLPIGSAATLTQIEGVVEKIDAAIEDLAIS